MQAHLPTSMGFLSRFKVLKQLGGVVFPQTTPTPFVPMEVGRCACITAQLQLEHW